MPDPQTPDVNSWLEDELHQQYLHDRRTVDASWSEVFEGNGRHLVKRARRPPPATSGDRNASRRTRADARDPARTGRSVNPRSRPALRIAENMTASLSDAVATSQRSMPV
jgi:2-oxoglutarate dehydrogenase complex dehydrogenase (E1) component-like enzyme